MFGTAVSEIVGAVVGEDVDRGVTVEVLTGWSRSQAEVNTSSYPATRVAGLFFHSRAVVFKSGCFVQKYWSGAVTQSCGARQTIRI